MSSSEPEEPVLVPVGEALDGVMIQALPRDASVTGLFAFVRLAERDGSVGWSVRVTDGLNDEETLGVLAGYLEHLKILAASSWHDSWPTDRVTARCASVVPVSRGARASTCGPATIRCTRQTGKGLSQRFTSAVGCREPAARPFPIAR